MALLCFLNVSFSLGTTIPTLDSTFIAVSSRLGAVLDFHNVSQNGEFDDIALSKSNQ